MTSEHSNGPVTTESDYANCGSTHHTEKSNGVINDGYFRSEPDVIVRQPITSQPSLTSLYSTGGDAWTYAPAGIAPIQRSDFGSLNNVAITPCDTKSRTSISTIPKDSISVTSPSSAPSRDWSRDLFEPFKDVRKSASKRTALTNRKYQDRHSGLFTSMPCFFWNPFFPRG